VPLLCALVLAGATPVHAQSEPSAIRFEWSGASDECPTASDVRARAIGLLGRDAFAPVAAPRYVLRVAVERDSQWRATVELARADGSSVGVRVLRAPRVRCPEIAESLALVVAMVADLQDPYAEITLSIVDEPEPPPPLDAPRVQARRANTRPPPQPDPTMHVAAGAGVDFGAFGPVAGSLHLAFAMTWRETFDLRARVDVAPFTRFSGRDGSVDVHGALVSVDGCLRADVDAGALGLCGTVGAGIAIGRGSGFEIDLTSVAPVVDAGVYGLGRVRLGAALDLDLEAGALVWPLSRTFTYEASGSRNLYEMGAISAFVRVFLRWKMGSE
jgi:hypothetical protein